MLARKHDDSEDKKKEKQEEKGEAEVVLRMSVCVCVCLSLGVEMGGKLMNCQHSVREEESTAREPV